MASLFVSVASLLPQQPLSRLAPHTRLGVLRSSLCKKAEGEGGGEEEHSASESLFAVRLFASITLNEKNRSRSRSRSLQETLRRETTKKVLFFKGSALQPTAAPQSPSLALLALPFSLLWEALLWEALVREALVCSSLVLGPQTP